MPHQNVSSLCFANERVSNHFQCCTSYENKWTQNKITTDNSIYSFVIIGIIPCSFFFFFFYYGIILTLIKKKQTQSAIFLYLLHLIDSGIQKKGETGLPEAQESLKVSKYARDSGWHIKTVISCQRQ